MVTGPNPTSQGVKEPRHPPVLSGGLSPLDLSRIAQDLQIRKVQVENVVQLLDEGNTIPFITRYRKERTGGLNEDVLRTIQERIEQLRHLAQRKQTILNSIENQGKLTPELRSAILTADNPRRLEDLYLPYKPKKRTLATAARDKGLEPLALAIWSSDPAVARLEEILPQMLSSEKGLNTTEDVLLGVQHILAETIAECADVRAVVRNVMWDTGRLCTAKSEKLAEGQGQSFKGYFQFTEPLRHIPPHRILAINRGEKENALQVKIEWDAALGQRLALERLPLPQSPASLEAPLPPPAAPAEAPIEPSAALPREAPPPVETAPAEPASAAPAEPASTGPADANGPPTAPSPEAAPTVAAASPVTPPPAPVLPITPLPQRAEALARHPHADFLRQVTADALTRLLVPSLENEIRRELKMRAEEHAVRVFARNLRNKLLAAPLRGRRVLAIDPGFRTGCKLAVLDEIGNLLEDGVIYPHSGANKRADARVRLEELVRKHQVHVIAIGNGTARRETEEVVSELLADLEDRRKKKAAGQSDAPPAAPGEQAPPPQAEQAAAPPPPTPTEPTASQPAASTPEVSPAATPETPTPEPAPPTAAPAAQEGTATEPTPAAVSPPAPESSVWSASAPTPAEGPSDSAAAPLPAPAPAPASQPPPRVRMVDPSLPEARPELAYVIVNEAGASVYSVSPVGQEEFPQVDATLRGTISIGRRLQDPLSELVKIDPQHVGVGLYQHDVNPKQMRASLDAVVESCVNEVGVDLNTASVPLLRHVSGLNQLVANDLVEYRKANGPFTSRSQLLEVSGIGASRYVQAAGFLKINGGADPLDSTWIHPESYEAARQILAEMGLQPEALRDREQLTVLQEKVKGLVPEEVAGRLHLGVPTVRDILTALSRPGRDPREDLPPPVFKKGMLKLEDLQPGMELKGTVLNVVDFGAFVDIGLKDSGLVHISQMANRYVKSPYDVVAVDDVVTVWILAVDKEAHHVSLTMIPPGTERRPPEKKPAPPRREAAPRGERPAQPQRGGRRPPPRGQRPGGPPPRPVQAGQAGQSQGAEAVGAKGAAPPPRPPLPPRRPRRQPPKPNLSQAALAGATPLGTFAELAAFWEAKKKEEPQAVPPGPSSDSSEGPPAS